MGLIWGLTQWWWSPEMPCPQKHIKKWINRFDQTISKKLKDEGFKCGGCSCCVLCIAPFCSPPSGLTGPSDTTFLRASWLWSWFPLAGGGRLSDWVLWMGRTPAMLCLCCFLAWLDWPLLCAAEAVWVEWKPRVRILGWNQLQCHSCKQKWSFAPSQEAVFSNAKTTPHAQH